MSFSHQSLCCCCRESDEFPQRAAAGGETEQEHEAAAAPHWSPIALAGHYLDTSMDTADRRRTADSFS